MGRGVPIPNTLLGESTTLKKLALGIPMAMAAVSASATALDFDHVQFTQFQANWNGYSLGNTNSFISSLHNGHRSHL